MIGALLRYCKSVGLKASILPDNNLVSINVHSPVRVHAGADTRVFLLVTQTGREHVACGYQNSGQKVVTS